jgi:hypothetical protein
MPCSSSHLQAWKPYSWRIYAPQGRAQAGHLSLSQGPVRGVSGHAVRPGSLNNPGRYYPYKYKPAVTNDLDITADVKSVKPAFFNPLEEGGSSYCPPTMTKTETVDMGGGKVCQGDVTYECSNANASQQCTCDPKEVKELVCTEGSR